MQTAPAPSASPARAANTAVDHVRDGAASITLLLDNDEIRIEHFRRGGEGRTLVITFDPLQYLHERPPFGHEFLRKQALDVVAVRKKRENFYQPLSRETFEAVVGPVTAAYPRVVSYGSSLGAYAALYYGCNEPWIVIASSPRNSTHPQYGAKAMQKLVEFRHQRLDGAGRPRCDAVILYDPRDKIDRAYLRGEVLPKFSAAQVIEVPFSGHPTNQFLGEIGFVAPFVRAVLADEPRSRWPRLDRRGKRALSPSYHQVLALMCLDHGHLHWAETLAARAIELNPRHMLALRTLGMVRLAQKRHAEAVALLEPALALSPQDPLTQSLLKRARNGNALPRPVIPPAAPVQQPLHRHLLRRLLALVGRG
ncbi:hypothetical protein LOC51_26715 [Rubrivivax sp. JA1024]|nr:hypothetical protein [Rubrivivax sp. JA1024]